MKVGDQIELYKMVRLIGTVKEIRGGIIVLDNLKPPNSMTVTSHWLNRKNRELKLSAELKNEH